MSKPSHLRNGVISASAAIVYGGALILLDMTIAKHYGTGPAAAVFQSAYALLGLLANVVSGGAIMGACIPIFVRLARQQGTAAAADFGAAATAFAAVSLAVVAALLAFNAGGIADLIAAGLEPDERAQAAHVLMLILPMLILHGISSGFSSSLMAMGHFAAANMSPVFVPLGAVSGQYLFGDSLGVVGLAYGVVGGALVQTLALAVALQAKNIRPRLSIGMAPKVRGEFWRAYGVATLAAAGLSTLYFANQAVAGSLSGRDLAAFYYGTKLVALFVSFCTTVVANTALPHFSAVALHDDPGMVWRTLRVWVFRTFAVLVPVTLIWVLLAPTIVEFVYRRGAFDQADVALVADVQRWFVLQVPFYVVGAVAWRMHNALGRGSLLAVGSLLILAADIALALYLGRHWGVRGVAIAHSIAVAVWMLATLAALLPYAAKVGYSSPPES